MFAHLIGREEIGGLGRFFRSPDPLEGDYEVRSLHLPFRNLPFQFSEFKKMHSNIYLVFQALLQFEEQQGAVVVRNLSPQEISRFPTKTFQSGTCAGGTAWVRLFYWMVRTCMDVHRYRCWLFLRWLTDRCNICLCDYVNGETLRTLPCLHSYHRDCIDHWLKVRCT